MSQLANIALAGSYMASLGVILAGALSLAQRKFHVFEDPRIDAVEGMLPGSNCGACGAAGCRQFALALIAGDKIPAACTVASREQAQAIADYLGVAVGVQEKRVARLACAGGNHVAKNSALYQGLNTCRAASLVAGGGKGCTWGCLGLGDCAQVCEFAAITMDRNNLPVVDEDLCTACGDCVDVCPKRLFSLQPLSHRLWVACRNQGAGDAEEALCDVICNACGRCAMDAPEGVIEIRNNLAVIDYRKNALASPLAMERCPTGAIVWLEDGKTRKGHAARKINRQEALRSYAGPGA